MHLRHWRHMNNKLNPPFFLNFTFFFFNKKLFGFSNLMKWFSMLHLLSKKFFLFFVDEMFSYFLSIRVFTSCLNSRQQRTKVFFSGNMNYRKLFFRRKKTGLLLCYYGQLCQGSEMMDVQVRSLVSNVVDDPRYKR